jgi:hypothetical protein
MTLWTAILLVCSQSACVAVGGPAVTTETDCWASVDGGINTVFSIYGPEVKIVDAMCISWGADA